MLHKDPKKYSFKRNLIRFGKLIVAVELAGLAGLYFAWDKLTHERDFRLKVRNNCPWALNYYYTVLEIVDKDSHTRKIDEITWKNTGKE